MTLLQPAGAARHRTRTLRNSSTKHWLQTGLDASRSVFLMVMDARAAERVVASLVLATGTASAVEFESANAGLRALGRSPLSPHDATADTPERLAPQVPIEVRDGVLELLYVLAGD